MATGDCGSAEDNSFRVLSIKLSGYQKSRLLQNSKYLALAGTDDSEKYG
jgi:hypothetical protein